MWSGSRGGRIVREENGRMNTKMKEKCLKAQEIYKTVGGINM